MYIQLNIETRSRDHCCRVKQYVLHNLSVACLHSFLRYPARKAFEPYCIVVFGLHDCTVFEHITS